jgi:hypothetical protein
MSGYLLDTTIADGRPEPRPLCEVFFDASRERDNVRFPDGIYIVNPL